MPFEPKLVSPDDGRGHEEVDLGLPADLANLADQLRRDADQLAARYPADWTEGGGGRQDPRAGVARGAARRPQFAWWPASVVAAALLVLAASWGTWRLVTGETPDARGTVNRVEVGELDSPRREADAASEALTATAKSDRQSLPWQSTESLLMHVNGPELEGMLDLMETQQKDAPLLSI